MLESHAESLVRYSPADGRSHSALASVRLKQGRERVAGVLFEKALAYAPTERQALAYLIRKDLLSGHIRRGMKRLDVLLRRWPGTIERLQSLILALARDPAGGEELRAALRRRPVWRRPALKILIGDAAGRDLLERLFSEENGKGAPPGSHEWNLLVAAFFRAGDFARAHALFASSLSPDQKELLGPVFDPDFELRPMNRYFAWIARDASHVVIDHLHATRGGGLALTFLDAPTKLGNVHQWLNLPSGRYRLRITASAKSLVTPRGLFWAIRCHPKGGWRLKLAVPAGSYEERDMRADFEIPDGCPVQQLILKTNVLSPSWRNRYHGRIVFHHVGIEREGG